MSASLVGSEMCIRDRNASRGNILRRALGFRPWGAFLSSALGFPVLSMICLLYTSDAADDM
eukprot:6346802-Alexandrium_andersonii.AAC.1